MRTKFVLFILLPLLILALVVYLFIDRWVEAGLESAGEDAVGARVEIDNLKLGVSPLGIRLERLQVANPRDPWKNLFETGRVAFAMNFGQLLRGKTIIETIEVNELILGTRRTTDGSLPAARRESASQSLIGQAARTLEQSVRNAPAYDLDQLRRMFNIDSLLDVHGIQTLRHLDSLRGSVVQASQQWDSVLADFERSKDRAAKIETDIRAIEVNKLNNPERITQAISTVQEAYNGINEIKQTVDTRKSVITGQISGLATSVGQIDDVVRRDIDRVMRLARLPDLSAQGIAELLLGKEIFNKAASYLYWVDWARANVPKYMPKPDKENPPRLKGQDIQFPVERSYPKLWIKRIRVSGGTDQKQEADYIHAKGEILDISSDQRVTGAPLTVDLSGTQGGKLSLTLGALFDRRVEVPLDEYKASVSGLRLADFRLGQSDFLPSRINGAALKAQLEIRVPGGEFDSRARMSFSNLDIVFDTVARNLGERLVRDVLSPIKGFDADVRIWNLGKGLDVALSTDLDGIIASRLKAVVGAEVNKLTQNVRARVEKEVAAKRAEVEKLFAQKRQQAEQQVQNYQTLINNYLASAEAKKKELNERLEKLKKGALEEIGKGLFKKKK